MYKRRKVFSKIGEKTFSTTEFQTQKEFAAKKEESKKEKVAKAATIGGATVGLGARAAGLGAEIGRKKVKKGIAKAEKELVTAGGGIKARKATSEAIDKMKKSEKILEKVSKKGTKAGIAGVGASVAGAVAYKALKKKKDQKEFAEKNIGTVNRVLFEERSVTGSADQYDLSNQDNMNEVRFMTGYTDNYLRAYAEYDEKYLGELTDVRITGLL
jgi:hypothetical protein